MLEHPFYRICHSCKGADLSLSPSEKRKKEKNHHSQLKKSQRTISQNCFLLPFQFDKANIVEKEPAPDLAREKADLKALQSSVKVKPKRSSVSSDGSSSFESNLGTLHETSVNMSASMSILTLLKLVS